jgi:hypothetical protein
VLSTHRKQGQFQDQVQKVAYVLAPRICDLHQNSTFYATMYRYSGAFSCLRTSNVILASHLSEFPSFVSQREVPTSHSAVTWHVDSKELSVILAENGHLAKTDGVEFRQESHKHWKPGGQL